MSVLLYQLRLKNIEIVYMIFISPGLNTLGFDFAYLVGFAAVFSAIGIALSWRYLSQ